MMAIIMGLFKRWGLWIAVGAAGVFAVWYILNQASRVGELESQLDEKQAEVERLGVELSEQSKAHEKEIESIEASMEALDEARAEAERRASGLSRELQRAGDEDEELEICLGRDLPDAVIDRLPH